MTAEVPEHVYVDNFGSMENLTVAALEKWDHNCCEWLMSEMKAGGLSAQEQILGLFDALFDWFQSEDYRGCLFINAAVEYGEHSDPIHQAAAAHKRRFASHVEGLLKKAGASDPTAIAEQLMIAMEGAIVATHTSGSANAGKVARELAVLILQDAELT